VTDARSWTLFVGRDRELGELLDAFGMASSGHGRLVLISGEPGVGKSRLTDELATQARERGGQVWWGRGWEDAGAPAFWPWVQAVRVHLRSTDAGSIRGQLGSGASDVAQMLPELLDLFPDIPPPPIADADSARFRLFDSTVRFLRAAAAIRPLVLVLEDLHAADTPSILLLRFLASQLADIPMLVVATYRDIELTPEHPLTSAITDMAREPYTRILALGGLDADAVGRLIQDTAGMTPQDHLVTTIWRETTGNPLFVGEAIRLLSAEGRLADVAERSSLRVSIPAGVRAVIARRIGYVPDAMAQALRLGAALGPEFSVEVLRRIGDYGPEEAVDVVDSAVDAGLLQPVVGAVGRYRFSHDLVRETLHDELSPVRRARLHRHIAQVLEAVYGPSTDAHLAELAFHYVEAVEGVDRTLAIDADEEAVEKLIDYARRAGGQASRSLAYEEADRLYAMALAGIELSTVPHDATRTEILLARGEVQARAGALQSARTRYLQAAELARRTGIAEHLAQAALGYGGRLAWARPGHDTVLIPLLQDALVMLGGGEPRLRVHLLTRLACAWRSSPNRRDDSAALSQQAVELARALDDPAALAYALGGRYWAIWWPENRHERHPLVKELIDVVEALRDGERMVDAYVMLFQDCNESGRMDEARSALEVFSRLIAELRQPAQAFLGNTTRSLLALLTGDYTTAEDYVRRELSAGHQLTIARDDESAGRMHRFLLRREQDDVAVELATIRRSVVDFPWYPVHRAALACALIDLGRDDEARSVFEGFAKDDFAAFYHDSMWILGMCLASEACTLLEDTEAAAELYRQLAPYRGRHAVGHAEGSVGAVDRYLGLLAATLGMLGDAEAHLVAAIKVNDELGARPWTAHCRHDLATVLRRRDLPGDVPRARALDHEAFIAARAIGMLALERRIGVDGERPTTTSAAPPLATATFRHEGDYWAIEFDGLGFRLRDAKGLRHLSRMLGAPGRELHALELTRLESPTRGVPMVAEQGRVGGGQGDGGPLIDDEARAAYRTRLRELKEEITEAESWNDPERLARLQDESDALTHELAAAFGLGGRPRSSGSAAERSRVSVTRAIRASLERITEHNAPLGAHLEATVRTGTFCSYNPDPRVAINWRF
jgi:tetratricopeptide (TPR) repeat protein